MRQVSDIVLVVEDDEASRRLIRAVLRARHYRVEQAEDAAQARAFLAGNTPGVVLLDLRLKGSNGLDLVRDIRADPRFEDLPIIAITAQAMKGDEDRILAAGCDAYLSKPIDTRNLPRVVGDFLMKGRSH
jgi:two-component system, cell cycle response regulator DivK